MSAMTREEFFVNKLSRYFHGEVKGMETDGLRIIRVLKKDGDR